MENTAGDARLTPGLVGKRHRIWVCVGAAFIAALLAAHLRVRGFSPEDDAYISYRYARNLANGHGFAYNQGERVLGTTTPLYVLILAALSSLTGSADFESLSAAVNSFSLLALLPLFCALLTASGHRPRDALLVALAATSAPPLVASVSSGMEADFFLVAVMATLLLLQKQRFEPAGALAGLSTLIRPEGALLAAAVMLPVLVQRPRRAPRVAALAALACAPWALFAWSYFGSPLPNSAVAKLRAFPPVDNMILYVLDYFGYTISGAWVVRKLAAKPLHSMSLRELLQFRPLLGALFALAGCLIAGAIRQIRFRRFNLVIFPSLFVMFYVAAKPLLFPWYFVPLIPFFIITLFSCLEWATPGRRRLILLLLMSAFIVRNVAALGLAQPPNRPASQEDYRAAAEFLTATRADTPPVMADSIGVFGYVYPGKIIDSGGLVSPEALRYLPASPEDSRGSLGTIPAAMIRDLDPVRLVVWTANLPRTLMNDPGFVARHRIVFQSRDPTPEGLVVVLERSTP